MEVQKEDAVFEFLPSNTDNCGFLFSIDVERKISRCGKAFMAQKLDAKILERYLKTRK